MVWPHMCHKQKLSLLDLQRELRKTGTMTNNSGCGECFCSLYLLKLILSYSVQCFS
jgi:hypothetical protein